MMENGAHKLQESSNLPLPKCIQLDQYYLTKFPDPVKQKSYRFFLYNDNLPTFAFCASSKEELDAWLSLLEPLTIRKPIAPVLPRKGSDVSGAPPTDLISFS